jgi:hypothetical protein
MPAGAYLLAWAGSGYMYLIVVQEQEDLSILLLQLIDQHGQNGRDGRWLRAGQELKSTLAKGREARLQCGENAGPKPRGVIIHLIQCQLGHRTLSLACAALHLGEPRGFAPSGGSREEGERVGESHIQNLEQPFARHQDVWLARVRELGQEQRRLVFVQAHTTRERLTACSVNHVSPRDRRESKRRMVIHVCRRWLTVQCLCHLL